MKLGTRLSTTFGLATLLVAGTAAQAAPLTNLGLSGGSSIAWTASNGTLSNAGTATDGQLGGLLAGDAGSPGGNVELSKFGGPATTLTGMGGGRQFALSSLTHNDWFDNGSALATAYITQAAGAVGLGGLLTPGLLAAALAGFGAETAGVDPWERVSDPNVSYVDFANDVLTLGLAGYQEASGFLTSLFPALAGAIPASGVQVSEVVKVSVDGGPAQYLFGFVATPSGLESDDQTGSFTGNYAFALDVAPRAVPEPASIALLGLGLLGLAGTRRRKPR